MVELGFPELDVGPDRDNTRDTGVAGADKALPNDASPCMSGHAALHEVCLGAGDSIMKNTILLVRTEFCRKLNDSQLEMPASEES